MLAWQNPPVSDWPSTAASLATAAGTLVLAAATFSAVRSSQRAARATEQALLAGIRPVIVASNLEDKEQKIGFVDDQWLRVSGGRAAFETTNDVIYMAVSMRNVGNGLAVLDRWDLIPGQDREEHVRGDEDSFRRLTRDIYVPAGDLGFWQGALRDREDPLFSTVAESIRNGERMTLDILYGDHRGGQRTITRFSLIPGHEGTWMATVGRHWNLDLPNPR